ncbi:predicted protein [Naegleria gruberi]|uniref:Predicted protein n=1 Tax=Naegleria gruberi TaxID=5762 RepID=D2VAC1_NAEGR|nr:uncharacterized protein NAEGRDRAFT_65808 [Naegleria gruberi]EFC46403.1 predicted protein [Naegleria gruberi]|eukprot:XP_002679147.1 predicted protein [Naegleria gruberi strain NEG-M]
MKSTSSSLSGSSSASLQSTTREEQLEDLEEHEVDKLDFIDYITQLSKLESTHKIVYLDRVPFVVSMRVIRPFRNAITSEEHCVTTSNHCALLNHPQKQQANHPHDHQLPNQTTISLLNNFAGAPSEQYYAGGDISNSCVLATDGGRANNGAASVVGSFTQSLANDVQQLKNLDRLNDRIKQQALRLLLTCTNGGDEYYEADLGFDDLQQHRKKISMNHISWANYLQYLRNGLFIYKRGEKSVGMDDPSESDIVLQFDEENKESKDVLQLVIYSPLKSIPQSSSSDQQQDNSQHSSSSNTAGSSALLNIRLKFLFELYAIRHISDFTQKLQQLLLDLVCHGNALSEIRALKDAKLISDLRNELQETRQKLRQAQDRLILYQPSTTSGAHDLGGLGAAADDGSSSSDQERKNSAPKRKAPKSLLNPNQKKRGQAKGAKIQ